MKIFLIIRDTASDFQSQQIIQASLNMDEAMKLYKKEVDTARALANEIGYTVEESVGDLSFKSFNPDCESSEHYNVRMEAVETKDDRPIRKRVEDCAKTLKAVTESGYIPFASPAPSSTEGALKREMNAAIAHLDNVLCLHDSLYGKK